MNSSIPNSVVVKHIERKYYKKYFYKICLRVDESLIKKSGSIAWSFRHYGLHPAQQSLLKEIADLPIENAECKVRSEGRYVTVFTNDIKFIEEIFDKLGHRITEYHCPKNNEHQAAMEQNTRIRVKKRLFENVFRYKVYFSRDWKHRTDAYSEVKEWLSGIENIDETRWAVNKTLEQYFNNTKGHKGYTAAVYLNEPEDLMMCQMRFHNEIQYIEEAVLISSL